MTKKIPPSAIYRTVIDGCLEANAKRATIYLSPDLVVNATRRLKGRKKTEIVLTIGKPNYRQRKFIAGRQKNRDPFPVKRMQLYWSKKK